MRSLRQSFVLIVILSLCGLATAESPRSLMNKGLKAEQRQDYETAYDYYKQAYDKRPDDLKVRVAFERTRFLAAASKVRRGQQLREQGKFTEALELFTQALQIDPSSDIARQEIRRTQDIMKRQAGQEGKPQESAPPSPEEDQLHQLLERAGGPVRLGEISNVPIIIKVNGQDSKTVYDTVGRLAGINVLFDPDYTSRKLSVDLQGVTLQQALDIVALESRTFWRPVTPNTIFVAADNTGKRRELEQSVIKTFYLGNVASPTDLQDVVNAIRTILEVQRIQQVPSQNAIIVRGTPDQLALAQKMIDDIDKSKPEVVVDIVVAQVRRDKVRQMGLLPPQTGSVALQGTNATTTPSTTPGTTTTTTTNTGGLNFNSLQHLNSTSYAVTISPLSAQLLFNDSDTKILENPQIRAADGLKASLNIGDRIPIATGSFGTPLGIGTGVGALGVNTQFQYIDVGVTIEITPHVHPDNEISLKATMTISNQTGTVSIGGISQPIISQRKVDHEIRLKDGEINMVGGILEDQITLNTSGVPFLSKIPILKYLFSQEDKEKHTNEVVFLLVPHIVRGQFLTNANRKAFDVGTGTAIDLRMVENAPAKTDSSARQQPGVPAAAAPLTAPSPAQQQFLPAQQQAPPVQAQPAMTPQVQPGPGQNAPQQPDTSSATKPSPAPAPGSLSLRLDPGVVTTGVNGNFNVNVALAGGQDISSVSLQLTYDPKVLQFAQATSGDFLGRDGQAVPMVKRDDPSSGTLLISAQRPPGSAGISGDGVVFNLSFTAKARGATGLAITVPGVRNSQNQPIQALGSQTTVNVN
ncbi:MAG TPA: cohesin domain-containing protein [Candidatus Angelobacter sp.]|nr:cohesin domain-containing protein [Candidatus Angelobacter sp.]